ncbi:MAG: ATP-dependent protease ATPase subunit HslU [Rickettsiaceae bacterium]|jgi:ATP-dependent HslUV protease ATP-binding subunit HslU|uniref:ATP-dependent protease ATPase subunit HslU n=1 Tax=Candidatus Megaera polyxenophila TaxID=988779 RepID=UPI001DAB1DC4|nr:ATP-dependent protease ATPase subunit HslU [Rickettsiales bacterium]MCE2731140.1 ATP-dependent protease ATPase subunit HslU [Rickettsiaceae bacterium]NDA90042.1 ATP-dependent protease ATPase subunit HslU [Alphaproteobacteria bacterium]UCM94553.1 MAG: ATP-dependent protease ATPase subunit HslU [Candidatus Megaira endosymbiont of Mesostigma viride]WHA06726.1 ATP-dependent protease ATPase subunit HslU [Candidatus Megaera polyxenophila]
MSSKKNMGLTPAEIVAELDRFIVGQHAAKKAVAVALRNRYRRIHVDEPMRSEISPKNILMIGSTGVGKTEIARRLARLADSPFIKVEATKFTEVGYVGRDVESIIRDLAEIAVSSYKAKAKAEVEKNAQLQAVERILDAVVGKTASPETREKFRAKILSGELNNSEIEIGVNYTPSPMGGGSFEIPGMPGAAMGVLNISDMIGKAFGGEKTKLKKLTVQEALQVITSEESEKMVDQEKIVSAALKAVENDGIVFLDEIDKITSRSEGKGGEVSREGVQRDLLPLIEGTNVVTKYGTIKTDHILFIASGAFHLSKPSDLLPELQGRLPIRVEMTSLTKEDLIKILVEPEASLIKQYTALIATEKVNLTFSKEAIEEIAHHASNFNIEIEDIGARRLHTILEHLLEDISFRASDMKEKKILIDREFVNKGLEGLIKNRDLAKFIL